MIFNIFELRTLSFISYICYLSRGLIASTRAFNLLTRAFNLPTRAFDFATRAFSLLTRGFELVTLVLLFHAKSFWRHVCETL